MISACKERASVKKGGIVEIPCPDLQPDTIVDVIILIPSDDKEEEEDVETKKYPVSDFSVLLKDGPTISLKQKKIQENGYIGRKMRMICIDNNLLIYAFNLSSEFRQNDDDLYRRRLKISETI